MRYAQRLQVQLPPGAVDALRDAARERGVTLAELVRDLLREGAKVLQGRRTEEAKAAESRT